MAISRYVKGITIEIDGDTRKLGDSLKDVDKAANSIQKELREVEKALKLDPKNVELLTQKKKLLGDAVEASKNKLDALRKAQDDAAKAFRDGKIGEDQYRALQREVIKAEQDLKNLSKAQDNINNKWDSMQKGLGKFGDKAQSAGKSLLPVTGAVVGAGAAALTMSVRLDDAMAKVSTVADTADVPLDQLRTSILQLSTDTGIAAEAIAEDVYNAISAGQSTGDAVEFVRQSAALAKAGFTDSGAALDILTTALNAYGMESEEAARVSDILIQTQNKGKVTVGELAASMGKIIPTANAAGVNIEQLGAGYALMTSNGIKSAEATTYMNSMLNELTKTGSKSSEALKKATGKTFEELTEAGYSLSDILIMLDEAASDSNLALKDMFGSAEAGKAALVLVKDEGAAFNALLDDMEGAIGTTAEALGKLETPGERSRKALNQLKNEAMKFGDLLAPVFEMLVGLLQRVADWFGGLSDSQRKTIVVVAGLVAALGPLLIFLGKVAWGVSQFMGFLVKLKPLLVAIKAGFALMTGPIGLVVAAIAGVIAIGVLLWKNWDKVKETAANLWDGVKDFFGKIKDFVGNAFDTIKEINLFEVGKNIVQGLIDGIKNMFGKIGETAKELGGKALDGIKNFLGIRSPSRVFEEMGQFSAEGFAKGLRGAERSLASASGNMGRAAMAGVSETMHRHSGTIRVEGINDRGQLEGVVDLVMDELRRGARRG